MLATIQGIPFTAAFGTPQWVKRPGFEPSTLEGYVPKGSLSALRNDNGALELKIGARTIKKLYLVASGPGDGAGSNENAATFIRLADKRIYLMCRNVKATVNMRRTVSTGIYDANDTRPAPVRNRNFLEEYYPQTLKDGVRPYEVEDLLEEFLDEAGIAYVTPPSTFPSGDILGESGFQIQGTASSVCQQLLDSLPGWGFDLNDEGEGYFFQFNDQVKTEARVVALGQYGSVWGGGVVGLLDRSFLRPEEIRVHFPVQAEMDFYYRPSEDRQFAVSLPVPKTDKNVPPRYLESYINNPVHDLPFLGNRLARGAMLNFHAFLVAFEDLVAAGEVKRPLNKLSKTWGPISERLIQEFYTRPTNFQAYSSDTNGVEPLYLDVFYEILRSYRLKYRLSYEWAPYVYAISSKQVGFIDPVSRSRGNTSVWCDFTGVPNERLVTLRKRTDGENERYLGYSFSSSRRSTLVRNPPAPAFVRITDQDTKAFEVVFREGQFGDIEKYGPFRLENPPLNMNISNLKDELGSGSTISDVFSLATILTLVPVPSRTHNNYHTVTIKPTDVDSLLPQNVSPSAVPGNSKIGACRGPAMDIFLPEDEAYTAFFKFYETIADNVAKPFFDPDAKFPEDALINKEMIDALAKAYAASHYSTLLDVYSGSMTVPTSDQNFNFDGSYNGSMSDPSLTKILFGPYEAAPDPLIFMPDNLRRQFLQRIDK